jgi:hypothetical protein
MLEEKIQLRRLDYFNDYFRQSSPRSRVSSPCLGPEGGCALQVFKDPEQRLQSRLQLLHIRSGNWVGGMQSLVFGSFHAGLDASLLISQYMHVVASLHAFEA